MAASYPTSIAAFPTRSDGDTIPSSDFDNPTAEIVAVETALLSGLQHALKALNDSTDDLGTSTLRWRDLFLARNLVHPHWAQVCQGRLTVTSATPVADGAAATMLYFTPYLGSMIALYDGTNWTVQAFTELSIAVPATTSQTYDVFVYSNSNTPTLELLAWTNDTTRATALVVQDGVYVKSGVTTRRYVGSFRTTTVSGQTEDSATKRFVWNAYNRVPRQVARADTSSWNYTTNSFRQANGSTANQIDLVQGLAEDALLLSVGGTAFNATAAAGTCVFTIAIGEDSTSVDSSTFLLQPDSPGANINVTAQASLSKVPAVGRHFYAWLEKSTATGTTTWNAGGQKGGMTGWWRS